MSGYPSRIGDARFTKELNQAIAVSNISTAVTAGVEIDPRFRHQFSHLTLTKNCTATVAVWGMATIDGAAKWLQTDLITFAETWSEVQLVRGLTAFKRVQCQINAIGSGGAINAHWGFSE